MRAASEAARVRRLDPVQAHAPQQNVGVSWFDRLDGRSMARVKYEMARPTPRAMRDDVPREYAEHMTFEELDNLRG